MLKIHYASSFGDLTPRYPGRKYVSFGYSLVAYRREFSRKTSGLGWRKN